MTLFVVGGAVLGGGLAAAAGLTIAGSAALGIAGGAFAGSAIGSSVSSAETSAKVASNAASLASNTESKQNTYNQMLMNLLADPNSIYANNSALMGAESLAATNAARLGGSQFGPNASGTAGAVATATEGVGLGFLTSQENLFASLSGATAPSSPAQALTSATQANTLNLQATGSLLYGLGNLYNQQSGTPASLFTPAAGTSTGGYLNN